MKKTFLFLCVLICSCLLEAAEFRVRVLSRPDVVPQGAPGYVTVEMTNISGGPVTVAYIAHSGFRGNFVVKRADGKPRHGCREKGHEDSILGPNYEVLPADWRQIRVEDVFSGCEDELGEYVVQFILFSNEAGGRISDGQGKIRLDKTLKAWTGEIRSEELHVEIVKPTGADLEAYTAFDGHPMWDNNRSALLSKFPTSTYAAWAVFQSLGAPDTLEPEKLNELFSKGLFPQPTSNSVPYPEWASGWRTLSGDDYAKWQIEWAERILQNHPEFLYARRLKLLLGVYNLQMRQEQMGKKWLEDVAKDEETHEGKWAQRFLELWKASKPKP